MEINTQAHRHGHGEISETDSLDLPRDFQWGCAKVSLDGEGGNYVLGHICWINGPPHLHPPMWAPDTETVFKLHSVLFGFYHEKRNKNVSWVLGKPAQC